MSFPEEDYVPISALQHWIFCPRQCALIHIEQQWEENLLTAEGRGIHKKVHGTDTEVRDGVRIVRGLRLRSHKLGLVGQSDVVEFHAASDGAEIPGLESRFRPYPIEYKRGKPKIDISDEVQLCAQALCLEEMLSTDVLKGALFYGRPHRRKEIEFTDALKQKTHEETYRLHEFILKRETPKVKYSKKCRSCSLIDLCIPKITGIRKNINQYLSQMQSAE